MSALAYLLFVAGLFAASRWIPGPQVSGVAKAYKLNGLTIFLLVASVALMGTPAGLFRIAWIVDNFFNLLVAANVFAVGLSIVLYIRAPARTSWKQFFSGAEANPAWFGVDLKMFSYRPSLLGLLLINFSFASTQYMRDGRLSTRMWLYQLFTFLYLANYFQFESGMLYTWDILEERFGFMLVWGDYVFVPFFYSLPGWYLLRNADPLPGWATAVLCATYASGFWLFRGANQQKHRFKQDPRARIWGKPAETVGGKLLVSGFWGVGRKLNYTGELLMYYAWTLPCGFASIVPYLVPLWLTVFFPHRAWRDEQRCRAKYGAMWRDYCRRAKFKMIPFIY
jgi:delta14-sterol reductase